MINKLGTFKDALLDNQMNEIVSKQFLKQKEVTATFTAANTATKVYVGFKANRYVITDKNANITVYSDTTQASDDQNMYLKASGAGTVKMKVWYE